jgi:glycosyltransferase involved in cell wall biosynthesis
VRILHICADPGIAPDGTKGAAVHFRSLHRAFRAAGHEVTAMVARPPASPLEGLGRIVASGSADERGSPPDFIYERYSLGHPSGLARARALGCPFILEVNAPLVDEALAHRPHTVHDGDREVERSLFRDADAIVAVSEPLRRFVAEVRGTSAGTAIVRNGCDLRSMPDLVPVTQERPVLAFLGHPRPWHGAASLVPILEDVRRRGFDARLLVIGGGTGAEEVRSAAQTAGVTGFVEITGPLPHGQALDRLARATVAVAPYPEIPFFYFCPIKVIECLAAGVPLVTTAQGDLPEIAGDAAVLVRPGDVAALAKAVAGLLGDPARREDIRRRARDRGRTFTWDSAARQVCELASGLLPGGAARPMGSMGSGARLP